MQHVINPQIYTTPTPNGVGALNGEPCYIGAQQGITQCTNCRAKYICKKSPEVKQSYE